MYKAFKGDQMDSILAKAINRSQKPISIKRIDTGHYQFGSKFFTTHLMEGHLLVRIENKLIPVE